MNFNAKDATTVQPGLDSNDTAWTTHLATAPRNFLVLPFLIAFAFILVGVAIVPFDRKVCATIHESRLPGELTNALERAEAFGHAYGVLFIVTTLVVVCRPHYRTTLLLLGSSLGAGLVADLVKLIVIRTRPSFFGESNATGFLGIRDLTNREVWSNLSDANYQSFPSAHCAVAFGFAFALGQIFPRGRIWFMIMAMLVATHRVVYSAHFPSDVLIGAAIGLVVGSVACRLAMRSRNRTRIAGSIAGNTVKLYPEQPVRSAA